jgi:hypothetical protein
MRGNLIHHAEGRFGPFRERGYPNLMTVPGVYLLAGANPLPPSPPRVRASKASVLPGLFFVSRAGLSSPDSQCMVSVAAQRRRRRPFFAGRHMSVDEPFGVVGKIVVGVECPVEHLAGEVLARSLVRNSQGLRFERLKRDLLRQHTVACC